MYVQRYASLYPFIVQLKFEFEFIYDHDNGFCALMIHPNEPDRKYKMTQI